MDDTFEVLFAISRFPSCEEKLTLGGSLLFRPIITLAKFMLTDFDDFVLPLVLTYCSWVKHICKFWVHYQLYKSKLIVFRRLHFQGRPFCRSLLSSTL